MRRLQITIAGRWFLALTIALGVVSLASGNNVIYLIESLLLSGLILSGILSERAISGLTVDIIRKPALAGAPNRDLVRVKNRKKHPIFCVEIGEWRNGE